MRTESNSVVPAAATSREVARRIEDQNPYLRPGGEKYTRFCRPARLQLATHGVNGQMRQPAHL